MNIRIIEANYIAAECLAHDRAKKHAAAADLMVVLQGPRLLRRPKLSGTMTEDAFLEALYPNTARSYRRGQLIFSSAPGVRSPSPKANSTTMAELTAGFDSESLI